MNSLTVDAFQEWLETYSQASRENDARASAELFSLDARYYESPFAEPMVGREAIYQYWSQGSQNLKDKEATFEIYSARDNFGIARWQSKFTVIRSGDRLALDCLFVVEFDGQGKCRVFREWWHLQPVASDENKEPS